MLVNMEKETHDMREAWGRREVFLLLSHLVSYSIEIDARGKSGFGIFVDFYGFFVIQIPKSESQMTELPTKFSFCA